MSVLTERPDPHTKTRVRWQCPYHGPHEAVVCRHEALEVARDLLAGGVDWVALEDDAAAIMRDQDNAERMQQLPIFALAFDAPKLPWWDLRRYQK